MNSPNNLPRLGWLAFLAAGFCGRLTAGELVFEAKEKNLGDIVGDTRTRVVFRFANASSGTVKIVDVKAGCDCTTLQPRATIYAPAAAGEIAVDFNSEGRHGAQRKTLIVTTDEPSEPIYYLSFSAVVRPVFQLSARQLTWAAGSDLQPQKVMLQAEGVERLALAGCEFDRDAVAVAINEIIPQNSFEAVVIPLRPLDVPARIVITFKVEGRPDQKAVIVARTK